MRTLRRPQEEEGVQQLRPEDAEEGASEAAGRRQLLRLWNRGSWTERLAAAGGIIIVGLALSAVGWIHGRTKL